MKILLTFRIKNRSTVLKKVLKQAIDDLNNINKFNLWEQLSAHVSILPRTLLQLFHMQLLYRF